MLEIGLQGLNFFSFLFLKPRIRIPKWISKGLTFWNQINLMFPAVCGELLIESICTNTVMSHNWSLRHYHSDSTSINLRRIGGVHQGSITTCWWQRQGKGRAEHWEGTWAVHVDHPSPLHIQESHSTTLFLREKNTKFLPII
jgi:hypothetical protein